MNNISKFKNRPYLLNEASKRSEILKQYHEERKFSIFQLKWSQMREHDKMEKKKKGLILGLSRKVNDYFVSGSSSVKWRKLYILQGYC